MKDLTNINNLVDFKNVLITDNKGNVIFYDVADLNVLSKLRLRPEEIIGKNITIFYRDFTKEKSTILQVLATGEALWNIKQELITANGNKIMSISSTFPIIKDNLIIGAIEFSKHRYTKDDIHFLNKVSKHKIYRKNNTIYTIDDLVTINPQLLKVKESLYKISRTSSTAMLIGATGTGKEIVAQSIHNLSDRYTSPFISLNCSAIPEGLIESILFGTVKGSYTGAENTPVLFEQAEGGTLFLDEINSLPIHLQVKLLQVIEDRQVRRIGGEKNILLNVRLLSATNEDPEVLINENRLRIDLFYRLCVVQVDLPKLKERREDIDLLLRHYIEFYNENMNIQIKHVDANVVDLLKQYDWPGNVREFRNAIETAYNKASDSRITVDDMPQRIKDSVKKRTQNNHSPTELNLKDKLESYEKQLIKESLLSNRMSMTNTAKSLGISKQSLHYKVKKYHLK